MIFPDIDPVVHLGPLALQLGPLAIRWYALAYVAGILLGWQYAIRLVRDAKLWGGHKPTATSLQIDDLVLWITLGIILGGRIGYILFYMLINEGQRAPLQRYVADVDDGVDVGEDHAASAPDGQVLEAITCFLFAFILRFPYKGPSLIWGRTAPRPGISMHSQNPFLDEFAKLTQAAMGIAQTAGEEAKTAMRAQADRLAAEFDLIRRDDFEALKAEVAALRAEVAALKAAKTPAKAPAKKAGNAAE